MSVEQKKRVVLSALNELLRPLGFRKRGATFVRELMDINHIIALQSSSRTTADNVVVTVNVAVLAPAALHSWDSPYSSSSGHWRERLGALTPASTDQWWSITDAESADDAADEIVALTRDFALPVLARLSGIEALLDTLERQASRGLTVVEQSNAAARIRRRLQNIEPQPPRPS